MMSCPCDCELPYPAMVCYHTPDMGDCRDGIVGIDELLFVLANWGACADSNIAVPGWLGPGGVGCEWGDIDRDGYIGFSDFLLVLEWWGPLDDQAWREWRCHVL